MEHINNRMSKTEILKGVWVVAKSAGQEFIGRIHDMDATKVTVLIDLKKSDWVELNPIYDFMAPVQQAPGPDGQMGLARRPIVMPHQFLTTDAPYYLKVDGLQFFDDMSKEDRQRYDDFISAAMQGQVGARAQAIGLVAGKGLIT